MFPATGLSPPQGGRHAITIRVVSVQYIAGVAQLVEQLTCNQQVAGSKPIVSSI